MYQCKGQPSARRAFQCIIWNIKRQNVQVCFSEVTSSVHDTPAMFTAKPPELLGEDRRLCLSAPNDALLRQQVGNIVGAIGPEWQHLGGRPSVRSRYRSVALRFR
jgi:hypothetical protein